MSHSPPDFLANIFTDLSAKIEEKYNDVISSHIKSISLFTDDYTENYGKIELHNHHNTKFDIIMQSLAELHWISHSDLV